MKGGKCLVSYQKTCFTCKRVRVRALKKRSNVNFPPHTSPHYPTMHTCTMSCTDPCTVQLASQPKSQSCPHPTHTYLDYMILYLSVNRIDLQAPTLAGPRQLCQGSGPPSCKTTRQATDHIVVNIFLFSKWYENIDYRRPLLSFYFSRNRKLF